MGRECNKFSASTYLSQINFTATPIANATAAIDVATSSLLTSVLNPAKELKHITTTLDIVIMKNKDKAIIKIFFISRYLTFVYFVE